MKTWAFELRGGPFDGAEDLGYGDIMGSEPPSRLLAGTCHGELCSRTHAHDPHVWWWQDFEADFASLDVAGYVLVHREDIKGAETDGRCVYVSDEIAA